jgi:two-component system chemotaxis response regulator CheY
MRMKVLVVDDDVVSRMMLMHLVDSCGSFELLEAEDGADAWRQLEQGPLPAITFCDLRMPHLSGMDLLGRVRADARLAPMPFVLVSAETDRDTVDKAGERGADGYIVKPFQADQVRAHLDALAPAGADEPPGSTVRRLGIDAARLELYLGGLHAQLVAAGPEIEQLLAGAELEAARTLIARLRDGCQTLGLATAAEGFAALEAIAPGGLDAERAGRALAQARCAALQQGERARSLPAGP